MMAIPTLVGNISKSTTSAGWQHRLEQTRRTDTALVFEVIPTYNKLESTLKVLSS
jgi:hypothetical protein